jgi:hypothetical protein
MAEALLILLGIVAAIIAGMIVVAFWVVKD